MIQELREIPNLNRHQIPGAKQSFVSEKTVTFFSERIYSPCSSAKSHEISLALLRGKAGLFYLTSPRTLVRDSIRIFFLLQRMLRR